MAGKLRHVERERRIGELADHQYGVVSRKQLIGLGVSERTVGRWVESGRLQQLHRDVFVVGYAPLPKRGHWLAAVLAYGDGTLLSHRSAAALWGLTRARGPRIDITALQGRQGTPARDRIRLHRGMLDPADRAEHDLIPVTSVARTLFDFAEVANHTQLEGAWEEADRLKLLRLGEVERVCERGYGRRALKPTRRLLAGARAVTRTRSPLEDRFQRFALFYGLPSHSTNVHVHGKEVDALWPAAKLIIELDSWEFHSHRAAFQRDRARDTRLLVAGYRTVRVTHDRLDAEAGALAAEIRELLRAQIVPSSVTED